MKTQLVVVVAALLLFAGLVSETEGFDGTVPGRKREMTEKV